MEKINNFITSCGNKLANSGRRQSKQKDSVQTGIGTKRTHAMTNRNDLGFDHEEE